jgi:ABC-type Fe3+-hydroxamate transport system substrate-binding protein
MKKLPQRIISLVPSQTELLFHLGLDEEVVGITRFCVHPEKWFRTKRRVGGTKNVNIENILSLKPDLVIANKEENVKEQIEAIQKFAPVYVSDVTGLDNAKDMIMDVGKLVHKTKEAGRLVKEIDSKFSAFKTLQQNKKRAAYFIWEKPYMAAGGDTFIHDMMQVCGFDNVFENRLRYPETTVDELRSLDCEVLLLSSEPFPFKEKHENELQPQLPGVKILLVDGEMFSWYGNRLLYAADYFKALRDNL